jgi:hypothetical protein
MEELNEEKAGQRVLTAVTRSMMRETGNSEIEQNSASSQILSRVDPNPITTFSTAFQAKCYRPTAQLGDSWKPLIPRRSLGRTQELVKVPRIGMNHLRKRTGLRNIGVTWSQEGPLWTFQGTVCHGLFGKRSSMDLPGDDPLRISLRKKVRDLLQVLYKDAHYLRIWGLFSRSSLHST